MGPWVEVGGGRNYRDSSEEKISELGNKVGKEMKERETSNDDCTLKSAGQKCECYCCA